MEIVKDWTQQVRFVLEDPVDGVPAEVGQYLVLRDDGPDGRITIRVGDTLEDAEQSEPKCYFDIAFLREIVMAEPETDVVDLEEVRRRWSDTPRYEPTRPGA